MATNILGDSVYYTGGSRASGITLRDNANGDMGWVFGQDDRGSTSSSQPGANAFVIREMESNTTLSDQWYENGTEVLTVGQFGDVGVNVMPTQATNSAAYALLEYKLTINGTFYASGSSADYKQDIESYAFDTRKLMDLEPVSFTYKEEHKRLGNNLKSDYQIGLIAEDVLKVFPEITVKNGSESNEAINVDYEKLSVLLLNGIQEMIDEIEMLELKVDR